MTPNLEELLAARRVTLRVLSDLIPPGPDAAGRLAAAIDRLNRARQYPGLPDELNPELLDAGKVAAFLDRLPKQPPTVHAALDGRTLYLNAPDLGLQLASPYTSADLACGYQLTVPAVPAGGMVLGTLHSTIHDVNAVLNRAADAGQAVQDFDWQAGEYERSLREIDRDRDPEAYRRLFTQLGETKFRRFQAAIVRRQLLQAVARQDASFAAEAKAAEQAALEYVVPPRHG